MRNIISWLLRFAAAISLLWTGAWINIHSPVWSQSGSRAEQAARAAGIGAAAAVNEGYGVTSDGIKSIDALGLYGYQCWVVETNGIKRLPSTYWVPK